MKFACGLVLIALLTACQSKGGPEGSAGGASAGGLASQSSFQDQSMVTRTITFMNSDVFEDDLRKLLKERPNAVVVEFTKKFSLNDIPAHLEPWLVAVKQSGGKVSPLAITTNTNMGTRALFMDIIEFVWDVVKLATQEDVFAYAKYYNVLIKYAKENGNILTVEFVRRPDVPAAPDKKAANISSGQ